MTNDKANVSEIVRFEAERFRRLIEAVEATPDAEFSLSSWAQRTACGFVACAVGNYLIRNPDCGLRLKWGDGPNVGEVEDDESISFTATARHFGIDRYEAVRLFMDVAYSNPCRPNVLRRLREFYASKTDAYATADSDVKRKAIAAVLPGLVDAHALRDQYAAMSDADLAARTDAAIDAGKLDGVLSGPPNLNDELVAFAGLSYPWDRAGWESPKLPPTREDFAMAGADAEEAEVALAR